MDLTPKLKPADAPGVWIIEVAGREAASLGLHVNDRNELWIRTSSPNELSSNTHVVFVRYVPVSSAARQAWIDGEDDDHVLRSIDSSTVTG